MAKSRSTATPPPTAWEKTLTLRLPRLGHRNWVVIADAAYPAQSGHGIETIVTGAAHLTVIRKTIKAIARQGHVSPTIFIDSELASVSDADAPGVADFRTRLATLLPGHTPITRPHEQIISDLHEAASMFEVLVLKTTFTIPYTSLFVRLDCGYWDQTREDRLRSALRSRKPHR
jgi:hypothetical protein